LGSSILRLLGGEESCEFLPLNTEPTPKYTKMTFVSKDNLILEDRDAFLVGYTFDRDSLKRNWFH